MRLATSPRLQNIGREEREAKLREFVATALVVRRASGDTAPACITLLARAPDSPVARAVASMATELTGANISLTAVLLDLDAFTEEPGRPSILDMSNADIRVLADPRFTSAHEQMVLSANIMWLGDCMRRDPAKRDAFELFHHDNPEATSHAVTSFNRLWATAQAVRRLRPLAPQMMVAGSFGEGAASQAHPVTRR
ncbi:MAG: hypothetical protein JNL45_04600 [Hyphomicrobium sp.]|jgi:hypothetical protein|nr:hypothetical protein [Hyphomicrobium sp.]